jgi:preprotein translocase subunit SecG
MTIYPLLAAGFIMKAVAAIWFIGAAALILIILVQKGRGGGLSAAFGGGMASGILGSKTGDFLTWVTIVLVGIFLTLAVVMARFYKPPTVSDYGGGASRRTSLPQESARGGRSPELPPPIDGIGAATSDTNEPDDANSLGG